MTDLKDFLNDDVDEKELLKILLYNQIETNWRLTRIENFLSNVKLEGIDEEKITFNDSNPLKPYELIQFLEKMIDNRYTRPIEIKNYLDLKS